MTIRERIAAAVGGTELRERQEAMAHTVATLANAYDAGKYDLPPGELIRQLSEYTGSEDLDFIMSLVGFEGTGLFTADLAREREYAIKQSAHAWRHNPSYQWSIWAWTNWGMGESVQVTPTDDAALEVFSEFWDADRNAVVLGQDTIHALSENMLQTGDRYLVYFASTVDGVVTVRSIPPDQFPEPPITDPADGSTPLFYKRKFKSNGVDKTIYYPDWAVYFSDLGKSDGAKRLDQKDEQGRGLLPTGAKRADQPGGETVIGDADNPQTVAVVQHIAFNRKDENDLRGWPLGTVSLPFHRAHRRFMEDRLAVAAGKAMFVRRKEVKAGSRGLASIQSRLQASTVNSGYRDTNPAAPAASSELDNQAVKTTDLPMTTGASDASSDNKMFAWQALLGDGLFPTSAGLDTARFATAVAMDKNQAMLWSRYRGLIRQMFQNMVKIVISFHEEFTAAKDMIKTAHVFIDTLSLVDLPPLMEALSSMFDSIIDAVGAGIMPMETARALMAAGWLMILQALGAENANELSSADAFDVGDDEREPESNAGDDAMEQAASAIAEAARKIGEGAG